LRKEEKIIFGGIENNRNLFYEVCVLRSQPLQKPQSAAIPSVK
jgi:hypothetical protein